jgi:hypothetical protein
MSLSKKLLALAAPLALLSLGACATGFPAQVSRFQAMPAPQGQSFVILPADEENRGGLEFAQYADLVRQHLESQGYRSAGSRQDATFVVELDYGVDEGRQEVQVDPFYRSRYGGFGGFGRFGSPGWAYRPYYSRFGYFGRYRSPFYYGWNDPFFWDDVSTRRVYTSFLELDIRRASDGQALFEGKAQARSISNNLTQLVPNLVEAMFTGFPGNSGEQVRITVPPPQRQR